MASIYASMPVSLSTLKRQVSINGNSRVSKRKYILRKSCGRRADACKRAVPYVKR